MSGFAAKAVDHRLYFDGRNKMGDAGQVVAEFSDDDVRVARQADGSLALERRVNGRWSRTKRGVGKLTPSEKRTVSFPDFVGQLTMPSADASGAVYDVAAWWRTVQHGARSGQRYLSVRLTQRMLASLAVTQAAMRAHADKLVAELTVPAASLFPTEPVESGGAETLRRMLMVKMDQLAHQGLNPIGMPASEILPGVNLERFSA